MWLGGQIATRSRLAALICMPVLMAVSLVVMSLGITAIPVLLVLLFVWGIGFSGLVLVWQQTLLLVGFRSPEKSMSIGVVLTQAGMAAGAVLGGVVLDWFGVLATPVFGAIITVATLAVLIGIRPVLTQAETDRAIAMTDTHTAPATDPAADPGVTVAASTTA